MRGIVIDPGAKPELYRLPDTLQELQRFMGGYAQRCPISNRFAALFYLPQAGQSLPTRHYNGRWFYGRLCLVGWRNARMTDLPMPLAEELTAPLRSELEAAKAAAATPEQIELDTRNAYDSLLLAGRAMQNAWKSVKPQLAKLPPDTRARAINQLTNTLTEIQTEAIKCL